MNAARHSDLFKDAFRCLCWQVCGVWAAQPEEEGAGLLHNNHVEDLSASVYCLLLLTIDAVAGSNKGNQLSLNSSCSGSLFVSAGSVNTPPTSLFSTLGSL